MYYKKFKKWVFSPRGCFTTDIGCVGQYYKNTLEGLKQIKHKHVASAFGSH
jgi:hypothetical protein